MCVLPKYFVEKCSNNIWDLPHNTQSYVIFFKYYRCESDLDSVNVRKLRKIIECACLIKNWAIKTAFV
jgi:hypothetical protein